MRIRLLISGPHDLIPKAAKPELQRALPGSINSYGWFEANIFADDPRAKELQAILKAHGVPHWVPRREYKDEPRYRITRFPVYDDAELAAARWLRLWAIERFYPWTIDPTSDAHLKRRLLVLNPREIAPHHYDAFMEAQYSVVVHNNIKVELEKHHFRRLVLAETRPGRFQSEHLTQLLDWPKRGRGPWWEVTSDPCLPRSRRSELADEYLPEGAPWDHPLDQTLHYRLSDLEPLGDSDIGASGPVGEAPHIVSQRFYQVCKAHNWRAEWVPVTIDPE